jgi:hypothetical protein
MRLALSSRLNPVPFRANHGAVLFEVVVALLLFVGAAAVITGALNASLHSVERLRLNTHASGLAVSVLSELQMGVKTPEVSGPQAFEPPRDGWTWELIALSVDGAAAAAPTPFRQVEVIVRHDEPPVSYRLTETIRLPESNAAAATRVAPESL